jgi:hypothetical protein
VLLFLFLLFSCSEHSPYIPRQIFIAQEISPTFNSFFSCEAHPRKSSPKERYRACNSRNNCRKNWLNNEQAPLIVTSFSCIIYKLAHELTILKWCKIHPFEDAQLWPGQDLISPLTLSTSDVTVWIYDSICIEIYVSERPAGELDIGGKIKQCISIIWYSIPITIRTEWVETLFEFVSISESIIITIAIRRIGSDSYFSAIRDAIPITIWISRIGSERDFTTIRETIRISIWVVWICSERDFLAV